MDDSFRQIANAMADLALGPATLDGVLDALQDLQRLRHLYPPLAERARIAANRLEEMDHPSTGFVLVPITPTPDMVKAAHAIWSKNEQERHERAGSFGQIARGGWAEAYYSAMIGARPTVSPDHVEGKD